MGWWIRSQDVMGILGVARGAGGGQGSEVGEGSKNRIIGMYSVA